MSKKLNIVHLIPALGIGGAEKIILDFCKLYNKEVYAITVAYWGDNEALLEPLRDTGVRVVKLNLIKVISLDSVKKIAGLLKEVSADLIHTHLIDADFLGFLSAKLAGISIVMSIHSYPFPHKKTHCGRYWLMSKFTNRVVCVSETVKKYLMTHSRIPSQKIAVVYNGININRFSFRYPESEKMKLRNDLGIKEGYRIIGNVSRLVPDKGQEYLLRAVPAILKEHLKTIFLIIGDGELRGMLIRLAKELKIEENVIFTGTRDDIPALLNIMDIFVFPTFNEALGISVLEAMAMGKPVVATNDAAIPEIVEHGREGFLVAPGELEVLIKTILKLFSKDVCLEEIGKTAQKRAQYFSMEKMVQGIEQVYQKVLKNR